MTIKELAKKIEGNYILQMNHALYSKDDLYTLLKLWMEFTQGQTIGDIENDSVNKNTRIIKLQLKMYSYYINADTTRKGVFKFLENKENDWGIIMSNQGNLNKITNKEDGSPIEGFYMYKLINR